MKLDGVLGRVCIVSPFYFGMVNRQQSTLPHPGSIRKYWLRV